LKFNITRDNVKITCHTSGAVILCMLGIMDQILCPAVKKAVELFKKKYTKVDISYLHLPIQQEEDGLG